MSHEEYDLPEDLDVETERSESGATEASRSGPPSPYWWLLILPMVVGGCQLSGTTGSPLPMLLGLVGAVAVGVYMSRHNIKPKKLGRVKPKKFDGR